MKELFLAVINRGGYNLEKMQERIEEYRISGSLSDGDRSELFEAAREKAAPEVNSASEVQKLWAEIRDLTARVEALEGGATEDGDGEPEVLEYKQPTGAHDAYYAGAQVSYNGKTYTCIAPAGVACVWSPDVMPTYWEQV